MRAYASTRGPAPRRALLLLCLVVDALLAATSCASPTVKSLSWKSLEGASLAFRREGRVEAGQEGRLDSRLPLRFDLVSPRTVPSGSCLEIEFAPGPRLPADADPAVEVSLIAKSPAASPAKLRASLGRGRTRLVLPLPGNFVVAGLELALSAPGAAPGAASGRPASTGTGSESVDWALDVVALREVRAWSGILPLEGMLRLSPGSSAWRSAGVERARITLPSARLDGLLVDYGPGGGGRRIVLKADGKDVFSMRSHPAGLKTVLPASVLPEGSREVELVLPSGVAFRAFAAGVFAPGSIEAADAELADFGRVLKATPPADGRDYDLYRWDLLPGVLVFDFRDLAVQDDYLKRLAFYVEKEGFRGRLAADSEIAALHGWNAHDYRAEDLAAFFSLAKEKAFPLNARETALRDLLAARGLIEPSGKGYAAGKGAIISVTRESPAWMRAMFLTHESTHAIYFADPEYRSFVQAEWKAMDREEKWFWKLFFGWKTYDVADDYLMANEYQAYLLQQGLAQTEAYFTKNAPAQVTENHKELLPRLEEYLGKYGKTFEARARTLDAWLDAKYGFRAGGSVSY